MALTQVTTNRGLLTQVLVIEGTFTGVTSGVIETGLNHIVAVLANDETGDSDIVVYKNKSDASTAAAGKIFVDSVTAGDVVTFVVYGY